jgi:hypothetical protein
MFLLIPVIIISGFEIYIYYIKSELLSNNNLRNTFKEEVDQYAWINELKSNNISILAGSSSVKYSLSCRQLGQLSDNKIQFANISQNARDPLVTYFILKKMNLKKVKSIYFGLDPWIFTKSYYRHRNHLLYLDLNFYQAVRLNSELNNNVLKYRVINLFKIKNTETSKNFKIPKDFGSETLTQHPSNFNNPKDWFQVKTYGWSTIQFKYLKKIVTLCKMNNIKFVAFIPPKQSSFNRAYKNDCTKMHKEYVQLLDDYKLNVSVFGKFNDLEKLGDAENFADAFHLNMKGQNKYSKLFFQQINTKHKILSKNYKWL